MFAPSRTKNKTAVLINHQDCQSIGRKILCWRARFDRILSCHEHPATPGSAWNDAGTNGTFVGCAAPNLGEPGIGRSEPHTFGSGQSSRRPSDSSRRTDRTASGSREIV